MIICLLICAIIDQEVVEASSKSIKKFLIDPNKDIDFNVIVHIDNHQRKKDLGERVDIHRLYKSLETSNCSVNFLLPEQKQGQPKSMYALYKAFLATDINNCLTIDDDMIFQMPVKLKNVFDFLNQNTNIIAFMSSANADCQDEPILCRDNETMCCLPNDVYASFEDFSLFNLLTPRGNAFITNGAMMTREHVEKILARYSIKGKNLDNNEDQISKMDFFLNDIKILMLAKSVPPFKYQMLPRVSMIMLDIIRHNKRIGRSWHD